MGADSTRAPVGATTLTTKATHKPIPFIHPADIALAIIPSLPRPHLERLVQSLIDGLDTQDGDPDLENAHDAEDDFLVPESPLYWSYGGPGCEISDPFGVDDEDGCNDPAAYQREHEERPGAGCPIADSDMTALECGLSIGGTA